MTVEAIDPDCNSYPVVFYLFTVDDHLLSGDSLFRRLNDKKENVC